MRIKLQTLAYLLLVALVMQIALMSCSPAQLPVTPEVIREVVRETVIVEGTPQIIEREVIREVTPTVVPQPATGEKVLNIGLYQDFTGLLPASGGGGWPLFTINFGFYDPLLEYNDAMELMPGLAQSWSFEDNDTTMVLQLQEGVTFHDGTPFNAEAVKVNLERYINPTGIVIWDLTNAIESIEVVDEYTVRLHFTEPNINMIYNLAQDPGFMISPTALNEHGEEWLSQNPVGTGPFVFERWEPGTELVMVRNPNYWREGLPKVDRVVWKILVDNTVRSISMVTGEINIETFVPPKDYDALRSDENLNLWVQPGGLAMITFNHTDPPFNIKENREAVKYAVDYEAISEIVYYGLADAPTGGPFPTGMWPYDPDRPKLQRDLERARESLVQAGNPDGFSIDIVYEPDDIGQQLAEIVQASLSEVGIQVNLIRTDFARFIEVLQADRDAVQMAIFTYGRMRVNAEEFFLNDWMCDGSNAFANWCNSELDETVLQAMTTFDHEERLELLRKAEDIFIEDVAGVPLAYPPFIHASNVRVLDYSIHPIGLLNFRWLDLAN